MFIRLGHITMQIDQSTTADELIMALGLLGRAQELGADAEELTALVARVRAAELEFRTVLRSAM